MLEMLVVGTKGNSTGRLVIEGRPWRAQSGVPV